MLVALEGIDGSGKTSVCQLVAQGLREGGVDARFVSKSSPDTQSVYVKEQLSKLRGLIWPDDNGSEHYRLGNEYWLFLMAAWFAALQEDRLGPEREKNDITLFDGWYYRFLIKFVNKGYDQQWLLSLFAKVRDPDMTVLLDVDPVVSWRRRGQFKEPELGRSDGYTDHALASYCQYQGAIRAGLKGLAAGRGWHVVRQSEGSTAAGIAGELVSLLLNRFRNRQVMSRVRA